MRVLPVVMGLGLLLALACPAAARTPRPRLDRVVITGNQRVEEEAIRVQLRVPAGHAPQPGNRRQRHPRPLPDGILRRRRGRSRREENGQWVLTYASPSGH